MNWQCETERLLAAYAMALLHYERERTRFFRNTRRIETAKLMLRQATRSLAMHIDCALIRAGEPSDQQSVDPRPA